MSLTRPASAALLVALACLAPDLAHAQAGSSAELVFVGETEVQIVTTWSRLATGVRGVVTVRTSAGEVVAHDGAPLSAWAAAGERGVTLALVGAELAAVFVPIVDGRPGPARRHVIHRVAGADRSPVGAAVAARPDGFAVFWQEASTTQPNEAYRTFLARFDAEGRARGAEAEVPAVWPLADAAWLPGQNRYYFLLYFGTGQPAGTRLCGVHIDADTLQPMQHPWWASRPSAIDEAHLVVRGPSVVAAYRGGPDGQTLLEADVTSGAWAGERPEPRAHGALRPNESFGIRAAEDGVEIVRRPIPVARR